MRWWQRLEVWVLLLSTLLPFFGIVSVSFGVLHLMRQGLLTVARQQSESTAEIITRSVERVMKEGRADITRALVEDLRSHAGVAGVDVLNDAGREAFAKGTDAPESEALDRLRADPVPFSVQRGERLLFYLPLLNGPNCRSCHEDAKNLLGATKVSIPLGEGCRQIRLALVPVVDLPRIYRVLALRFGVVPLESPARMHRRFGATLLATALRRDKPFQHAAIICRRDARIRALPDLRGRSFAFGDINSTSSHIVPRAMLLEAGVGIEHLGSFEYLGHHDAVAAAVLRGDYDAGAAMESVAARYEAEGLMTLVQSPPIPEFNICAAPDLPSDVQEVLRGALLALTRDGAAGAVVLETLYTDYTGFALTMDADYARIREMMQRLGLLGETAV